MRFEEVLAENFYRETVTGLIQRVSNTLKSDKEAARNMTHINAVVCSYPWYFGD
ncbi:hypothetical protein [Rhodoferax sp.]|uniref:hypothetical protein n=1 Tax=Rhodoferax sp. TaxID=50421 RepID=UPI0025DF5BA0|nr:hypothetical protein [Rhodoferax sp.]